jgi:hypothetical protein
MEVAVAGARRRSPALASSCQIPHNSPSLTTGRHYSQPATAVWLGGYPSQTGFSDPHPPLSQPVLAVLPHLASRYSSPMRLQWQPHRDPALAATPTRPATARGNAAEQCAVRYMVRGDGRNAAYRSVCPPSSPTSCLCGCELPLCLFLYRLRRI